MNANQVFLVVLALSIIVALALPVVSLKWGLKWAKIAEVSSLKAIGLYLLILLANCLIVICAVVAYHAKPIRLSERTMDALGCAVQSVVPCLVIAVLYKVRLLRAAIATIPFVLAGVASVSLAKYVVRPYAYEGFSIPTNGMAPTLLGDHWEAPCPRCGEPAFGSAAEASRPIPPEGMPMVCSKELTTVYVSGKPTVRGDGDRILACKLLKPKRWDIMVFRFPQDPTVNYAKRVVGLPGEKLEIREGAIWINGQRQEPPDSIRGIHYSPTIESHGQVHSGPGSVPVELSPDEFFVLGDFVDQSSDSRFWEQGAPGHPPYAVPASHLVGVVINIYWPPSRWTSFR